MGVKSTHLVTREFAIAAIMIKLQEASDEVLADTLESVLHNGFYNFWVVSQEEFDKNKDEEFPMPTLTNLNSLPEYNNAG